MLGDRFADALQAASEWHRPQGRKGSRIPYLGHLLTVAGIVIEAGADEDTASAALLHDAIEDQCEACGGEDGIRRRFGKRVADIVGACSDSDPEGGAKRTKSNWRRRKEQYVAELPSQPPEALLVSLADKIHNARSIVADLRINRQLTWERFRGGRAGTLWYYRSLRDAFRASRANRLHRSLVDEFDGLVSAMEELPRARA